MDELFETKAVSGDSPRLAWLKQKAVRTWHFTDVTVGDECPETGEELHPWVAWILNDNLKDAKDWQKAGGATEHDAIVALALKRGWNLWNETASPIAQRPSPRA